MSKRIIAICVSNDNYYNIIATSTHVHRTGSNPKVNVGDKVVITVNGIGIGDMIVSNLDYNGLYYAIHLHKYHPNSYTTKFIKKFPGFVIL